MMIFNQMCSSKLDSTKTQHITGVSFAGAPFP